MKKKTAKSEKPVLKVVIIAIVSVLIAYCAFVLIHNYADISRLKTDAVKAQTAYDQQVKENEKLKAILESDNKDDYIEEKAREKGYVKEDETVFYDISDSK